MKGNYLISDVFLDANANSSIVKQPFNIYVYFQAVRGKQTSIEDTQSHALRKVT